MAKSSLPSINEVAKSLTPEKLLPVYFLCGEDNYAIDTAIEAIQKTVDPLVESDFDREVINAEKSQNISQILDLAFSFPFGGNKKFVLLKNFEKLNDKKELSAYVKNPPEFTILVITNNGKISDSSREPYSLLLEKKYLFEARSETGSELVDWVLRYSKKIKLNLSEDNARALIEIVGEDKSLLEMQLQKLFDYISDKREVTFEDIQKISSNTKIFSIFDFQDAIGNGDKSKALEIAFNLLDSGQEIIAILNMVAKFILTLAQIVEMVRSNINDNEAAKLIGVSWYYYINCKKASFFLKDERLLNASRALLQADLAVKTSASEPKTVIVMLISEMMK
jgi:DNA polymerase-3 subunit delta